MKRYIPERVPAAMGAVGILLTLIGVMMTESGHGAGWWLCGAGAALQLTAMIIVKEMWPVWEKE